MSDKNRLLLIDGSGYIFRAYYALPPLYRKSDGLPTGAVNGFCNMLYKLLEDTKSSNVPSHLAVVFDSARKTFRNDIYKDYKANRGDPPEDLIPQFKIIKESVKAFGIPSIELSGFEADDIIATYATQAEKKNWKVSIISSDKDLMQIVTKNINMLDTMKNKVIGPDEVIEKFGVGPDGVIDVQALAGDSSDNVPGAPGIGIKTAAQLINEYGSIENLIKNFEKIKQQKRRETIRDFKDQIKISKELVTLKKDVSNIPKLEDLKRKDLTLDKLVPFLENLELKKLSDRIRKKNPEIKIENNKSIPIKVINKKPQDKKKLATITETNQITEYKKITSTDQLDKIISDIYEVGHFVFDVETDSLNIIEANLIGISICNNTKTSYYIPLRHIGEDNMTIKDQIDFKIFIKKIKPVMEDESIVKIGHNIKYDIAILKKYEIETVTYEDTMLMSYICDANVHRHNMDDLAKIHLNTETIKFKEVVGSGKSQITFDRVNIDLATKYAAEDAEITYKLFKILSKRVFHEKNKFVYESIEKPLIKAILKMEMNGIKVDSDNLSSLSRNFSDRVNKLENKIFKISGSEFNIGSPKQLSEVLFDNMGLTLSKKTKTGERSTGIEVLEDLSYEGHEIAQLIIEWRQLSKLKNTYADSLPNHIAKETGRIHTSYAMASTSTGRLASSDPNLQNIPIRTNEGRLIREAFVADKGNLIFSADYSQIELRVLAHIADVGQLKQAFNNNEDIHQLTASEIFNVSLNKVTADLRRKAKAVNFGIIYGISAFGLAKQLSISNHEANEFIKRYFSKFSGIRDYMENTKNLCRENGFVETLCGRKCFFPRIKDKNFALRSFQERAAINAPIQGTAADIIKFAMIKIEQRLKGKSDECKMLLQVHDELVFEIKKTKIEDYKKMIIQEMETALDPIFKISVPLSVDSNYASNWNEAH